MCFCSSSTLSKLFLQLYSSQKYFFKTSSFRSASFFLRNVSSDKYELIVTASIFSLKSVFNLCVALLTSSSSILLLILFCWIIISSYLLSYLSARRSLFWVFSVMDVETFLEMENVILSRIFFYATDVESFSCPFCFSFSLYFVILIYFYSYPLKI